MKIIIFLGPPGSGKGTQAKIVSKKFNMVHISPGDIFRDNINKGTELGKQIKSYVEKGVLVPDDIVFSAIKSVFKNKKKFILDGFPRNIVQAQLMEKFLNEKFCSFKMNVLYFHLSDKEVIKRLTSRRLCPNCGRNYNIYTMKPKFDEQCDICNTKLVTRKDDELPTVKKRLQVYKKDTVPLIKYYTQKKLLTKIDASKSIDEVTKEIYEII